MNTNKMRYYAKRLGHKKKGQQEKMLLAYLQNIIKKTKAKTNIEDINSDSDNDVFIEMQNDIQSLCVDQNDDDIELIDNQNYESRNNRNLAKYRADEDEDDEKGEQIIYDPNDNSDEDIIITSRPQNNTFNSNDETDQDIDLLNDQENDVINNQPDWWIRENLTDAIKMFINQSIDRIPYNVFYDYIHDYMKQNDCENYSDDINNILQELKKQKYLISMNKEYFE